MKALVYKGPGRKAWVEVPTPTIQDDTDAIVRVDCTTICGTDLHILTGDLPEVTEGRVLGHEAVGTVEAVGSAVTNIAPGDRVLVSCVTRVGAAPTVETDVTASAWAAAAGSWATSLTGPKLSTFEFPLPIPRPTRFLKE